MSSDKRSQALVKGIPQPVDETPQDVEMVEIDPHPMGLAIKVPRAVTESGDPFILPLPSNLREPVYRFLFDHFAERTN